MSKDAYYFSHDSNAKDDPKCVLLIEQLGMEGYGIFWVLIETLRDQPEYKYPIALIPALSRRYNTTAEKMRTVIMQYGLFETENDEFFYSDSLNRRMGSLSAFRESQRNKALKRWNNAGALPRECNGNADPMPVKESKVKESKVNNEDSTPDEPATVNLNYEDYRNAFISACPSLPAPNKSSRWNGARKKAIRDKHMTVEQMETAFERIEKSDFLSGRSGKWQGCSIDWILKPANWQKIVEGNYDNRDSVQHGHETSYDLEAYERQSIFDEVEK